MEGIGWYAYEVLKRITSQNKDHQFYFLFDRKFDKSFIFSENVTPVVLSPQARHPVLYKWWFEKSIPRWIGKNQIDLFFSPEGYISLKLDVPTINVIHDLNFEHYPAFLKKSEYKFYKKYFPQYAKKANEIITVSHHSKSDIVKTYGINEEKVNVIYNGIRDSFSPLSDEQKSNSKSQFAGGHPYFVYLGSIHPRKNLDRMLMAFDSFCSEKESDYMFLISGRQFKKSEATFKVYTTMKHRSKVKFLDYVKEDAINDLVAGAEAMIYVPLYEGFGLPVLEAFQCEVPVVTSNVTSLPEIAREAAILVDPNSVREIKESMLQITQDDKTRKDLIEKGKLRAKEFSWDKCAKETWKVIERNLG